MNIKMIQNKYSKIIWRHNSLIDNSIEYLISLVFDFYNLNWEKYIEVDPSLLRKGDPEKIYSDPKKLVNELGWSPKHNFEQLVERCVLKYESF